MEPENRDGVTIDSLRRWLLGASILRVLLMIIVASTFWAATFWIIAYPCLSITAGLVGIVHFYSIDQLYGSQCCCSPRPAILTLYTSAIILACVGLVAAMQSLITILSVHGDTKRAALCAVCGGASLLSTVLELVYAARCKHLRDKIELETNQAIMGRNQIAPENIIVRYPDPYQRGVENGQVYYGVPMRVQMHVASLPPFDGRLATANQQQQQQLDDDTPGGGVVSIGSVSPGNVLAGRGASSQMSQQQQSPWGGGMMGGGFSPTEGDKRRGRSEEGEEVVCSSPPPYFQQPPTAFGYSND